MSTPNDFPVEQPPRRSHGEQEPACDLTERSREHQIEWCSLLFSEVSDVAPPRSLRGPHYQEIENLLQEITSSLQAIHPALAPRHIMPMVYMPKVTKVEFTEMDLSTDQRWSMNSVGRSRLLRLRSLGTAAYREALKTSQSSMSLDTPPYCHQGSEESSLQACFNACFRMVYAGITNELLSEHAVTSAVESFHPDALADDEEYLKVFTTPSFHRSFPDKKVSVLTITGTSLETIAHLSSKAKEKLPGCKVFCIVNLQTDTYPNSGIWHTNVLLDRDDSTVTTHDPSDGENGQAFRTIDSKEFHERWAVAFNRAHVIIER